ncbi:hypothetical protein D3C72_1520250 [compost metagenome]
MTQFLVHQHGLVGDLQPDGATLLVFQAHRARGGSDRGHEVLEALAFHMEVAWARGLGGHGDKGTEFAGNAAHVHTFGNGQFFGRQRGFGSNDAGGHLVRRALELAAAAGAFGFGYRRFLGGRRLVRSLGRLRIGLGSGLCCRFGGSLGLGFGFGLGRGLRQGEGWSQQHQGRGDKGFHGRSCVEKFRNVHNGTEADAPNQWRTARGSVRPVR